jgi:hypothetical protein
VNKTTKLYYYSIHTPVLKEVEVEKETTATYFIKQSDSYSMRIPKNDGGRMRNGDSFFFTEREMAIEALKELCRARVASLSRWQKLLAELEGNNEQ